MPSPTEAGECKCGALARMADDPKDPVEFDADLNEYHLPHKDNTGYSLIYFCPLCGGRAPASKRGNLFQKLDQAERHRLSELTKDLHTVQDLIAAFGQPDVRIPLRMTVITEAKEGLPETTQSYPVMIYNNLSDVAVIHATVYPNDKVAISFQTKPKLAKQAHEVHFTSTQKEPQPEPEIDIGRTYDVYCAEPGQSVVVYRNARFKSAASLLPSPGTRGGFSQFIELEQSNGQSVFISRGSIFRFCEPGTLATAEPLTKPPKSS